ncbi:MAG: hypothetical protein MJZ85_07020 [Bacteroidales bacterium]|nr:hypothetical protein [Bacteroidales bacterium]
MRKRIFLTAVIFMLASGLSFAQSDGFFSEWENLENRGIIGDDMPNLPGIHGASYDQGAPLGTGILILTALGASYTVAKRKTR